MVPLWATLTVLDNPLPVTVTIALRDEVVVLAEALTVKVPLFDPAAGALEGSFEDIYKATLPMDSAT